MTHRMTHITREHLNHKFGYKMSGYVYPWRFIVRTSKKKPKGFLQNLNRISKITNSSFTADLKSLSQLL